MAIGFGIFAPLLGLEDAVTRAIEEQSIVMIYLHDRFWIIAALALILVVVGAIRYSHRVAGPLVRFKRNLKMLGKQMLPLRTRRSDFLKEEVCVLNRAVAGVSARTRSSAPTLRCRRADAVAETARRDAGGGAAARCMRTAALRYGDLQPRRDRR